MRENFAMMLNFLQKMLHEQKKIFLYQIVESAIKAGASTVNIPDTVGYSVPTEYGGLIADIKNNVPNIDKAIISVHCHDDLGFGCFKFFSGSTKWCTSSRVYG